MTASDAITSQAIDWRIRLRHARAEEWEAFALWLTADPAHAAAYDAVTASEAGLDEALAAMPVAANDETPPRRLLPRLAAWGTAVAAALVAAVTLLPELQDQHYIIVTRAGEHRTVTLAGTEIALNGDTRLRLDRGNPRVAELVAGEAGFRVTHDAAHPFVIEAGGTRLTDVGTEFNVTRAGDDLRVAVADGEVALDHGGSRVALKRGQSAQVSGTSVAVTPADPSAIGGWRRGRLSYQGAATSEVAADVARTTGLRLVADRTVAGRPFTGVIRIQPEQDRMLAELGSLLDVAVLPADGGRWTLTARDRAPR